jgi:hypothetical protein
MVIIIKHFSLAIGSSNLEKKPSPSSLLLLLLLLLLTMLAGEREREMGEYYYYYSCELINSNFGRLLSWGM